MRQKGSGAGRKFNRKVSKSNTLPIQISLTLVETLGGTTSVGLWFRSLSWTHRCAIIQTIKISNKIILYIHIINPKFDFIVTLNPKINTSINTSTYSVSKPHTDSASDNFENFIDAVGQPRTNIINTCYLNAYTNSTS